MSPRLRRSMPPGDDRWRGGPGSDDFTRASLGCAIAVPLLYYGVQIVAAPFFPDFSVLSTLASDLGSDRSTRPWVFNSLGFALWRLGVFRAIKAYFIASIVLLMVMIPIMIMTSETSACRGLIQRISSLPVFVPIGVAGLVLARRIKAAPAGYRWGDGKWGPEGQMKPFLAGPVFRGSAVAYSAHTGCLGFSTVCPFLALQATL